MLKPVLFATVILLLLGAVTLFNLDRKEWTMHAHMVKCTEDHFIICQNLCWIIWDSVIQIFFFLRSDMSD